MIDDRKNKNMSLNRRSNNLTSMKSTRKSTANGTNDSDKSRRSSTISRRYSTQIHRLCDVCSWSKVSDILPSTSKIDLLEKQGFHEWTPLMICCVRAPFPIVKSLVLHSPEACLIADKSQSLPIHFVACWRRDGQEQNVLKALLSCRVNHQSSTNKIEDNSVDYAQQIECTNRWGQTPLHSLFDSKELPKLQVVKIFMEYNDQMFQNNGTVNSSAIDDILDNSTAKNNSLDEETNNNNISQDDEINEECLNYPHHSLVKALATKDSKARLPLHLALSNGASDKILQALIRAYPTACCMFDNSKKLPMQQYYLHLTSLKPHVFRTRIKEGARVTLELLISYTFSEAEYNKQAKSKIKKMVESSKFHPLHVSCEFGLSYELIKKLCKEYPTAAKSPKPESSIYPFELHLRSWNAYSSTGTPQNREEFDAASDLLFSLYPGVPPSDKDIPPFRKNVARLDRFERKIREDAKNPEQKELTPVTRALWAWMCNYSNPKDPTDTYSSNIRRIMDNLDSNSLWKLSFVKQMHNGQFLKGGHDEFLESEKRTYEDLMQVSHLWQCDMLKFLCEEEALLYSSVCKHTFVSGVRYLKGNKDLGNEKWEQIRRDEPTFWKNIELAVHQSTHSIILTYKLTIWENENYNMIDDYEKIAQYGNWEYSPGLLIFSNDGNWVDCKETRTFTDEKETMVKLSFVVDPSTEYEIRYYAPPSVECLEVTQVSMKQLLFCRNEKNLTPLQVYLSLSQSSSTNIDRSPLKLIKQTLALLSTSFPVLNYSPIFANRSGNNNNNKKKYSIYSTDSLLLHNAVICGTAPEILKILINSSPRSLVETDENGCTPLHLALRSDAPSLDLIQALILTSPGENAARLKDVSGRLPLHIAAERGLDDTLLNLMVNSYADGCYRQTRKGDLPLHLLVRSGEATLSKVELLIKPIMGNESICRMEGSKGVDLPLHIAARFGCSFEILEKLLRTYPEAATRTCREVEGVEDGCALDLFEKKRSMLEMDAATSSENKNTDQLEDFERRSNLLFVHYPMACPQVSLSKKLGMNGTTTSSTMSISNNNSSAVPLRSNLMIPYRKDMARIRRLVDLITREATRVASETAVNKKKKSTVSDTARLAWLWLTTCDIEEEIDEYAALVEKILTQLSSSAVKVLAHIEWNGLFVKDCAVSRCRQMILSRIRFVGRYEWSTLDFPLHKSDTCLVMRAKDFIASEEYHKMRKILEDSAAAASEGQDTSDVGIPLRSFFNFCKILGISESEAKHDLRKRGDYFPRGCSSSSSIHSGVAQKSLHSIQEANEEEDDAELDEFYVEGGVKVSASTFESFCNFHGFDSKGIRKVVIKFISNKHQFERERAIRDILNMKGPDRPVVPILEDYDLDRMIYSPKDALYAKDIQEKNECSYDLFRYKYALVLTGADRDLAEIHLHESPEILQIRDYMSQVGNALQKLHEQRVIHGDLRMANIVRIRSQLTLIDLDSSYSLVTRHHRGGRVEYYGGSSHKFSSGILPPELITRVDLSSQKILLERVERYWKNISDDAKAMALLTPDDISTITSVVKNLMANFNTANSAASSTTKVIAPNSSSQNTNDRGIPPNITCLEDVNQDWKDILSMALITISFDDLPMALSCCNTIVEFSKVWSRLLLNAELWDRIRPRIHKEEGCAYLVKAFNDCEKNLPEQNNNVSILPFNRVQASECIDIWAFGVLIFSMCSKCTLFPVDHEDNLTDVESYAQLFNWDKRTAEKMILEKVADPLAQDLLLRILVPVEERLRTMDEVLCHPFFGPACCLEAVRILEKHEELQLMLEETAFIPRMTSETLRRLENSTEKTCKIVFEEEKIVVPTCLIVLPYKLALEGKGDNPCAKNAPQKLVVEIGVNLLEINRATARMSFWLMMKKNMSGKNSANFKAKMKEWLRESKNGRGSGASRKILEAIGCGDEYKEICIEMLQQPDTVSNARSYIKDPMSAARLAIQKCIDNLIKIYSTRLQYLYLVDEYNGIPVIIDRPTRTISFTDDHLDDEDELYPIEIEPNTRHFQNFFIPFVNISMMSVTAKDGLNSLKTLLGLTSEIPQCWKDLSSGLIHKSDQPSSVAEFAVLQDVLRKQDFSPSIGETRTVDQSSIRTGVISEWSMSTFENGCEMEHLEIFFREYDPVRMFSEMRRVAGFKNGNAIWTTETVIRKLEGEQELAELQQRLRELKKDKSKMKHVESEIQMLNSREKTLVHAKQKFHLSAHERQSFTSDATTEKASNLTNNKMGSLRNIFSFLDLETNSEARDGSQNGKKKWKSLFGYCADSKRAASNLNS